jgi:hypothetical protein
VISNVVFKAVPLAGETVHVPEDGREFTRKDTVEKPTAPVRVSVAVSIKEYRPPATTVFGFSTKLTDFAEVKS